MSFLRDRLYFYYVKIIIIFLKIKWLRRNFYLFFKGETWKIPYGENQ